jgi:predicted dehydrogenase/NADPH:quinone reductase-like Zn-dependent oxidoreductase
MKQVLIRRGQVVVEPVPAPVVEPGTVLVRLAHSCISVGTELAGLRASAEPLWRRAIRQPDKVRRVADVATSQGVAAARDIVTGKLAASEVTGYSAAGTVIEIGAGIHDLRVGDCVACAGAQAAHHAEVIRVPRNLVAPIPDGLATADASTVTLGAIAMQGVRRAQPTFGETFVVIGLGIVGQLTAQVLRVSGCRVIGSDLSTERLEIARGLGMPAALQASADEVAQVHSLTGGVGADGVIITAASDSSEIVSIAFRMCRRKGRVVLVGDVGLDLRREDMYSRELDFLVSTSYGPGRYDPAYEEDGVDYPIGYVRWTENRNMVEYLRLLAEGRVRVGPLIRATYSVEDAPAAYAALSAGLHRPLCAVLRYSSDPAVPPLRTTMNPNARSSRAGAVRVALIGAGNYAKGMHLPMLRALSADFSLRAVVSRSGPNATATAKQYGAAYATTEIERALDDPDVDLVLIATRHHLHASLALEALRRGKHVFVEKPLALTREDLAAIVEFFDGRVDAPILQTGFNRRFSPFATRLAEIVSVRTSPMILDYRMNAGYISLDDWVHGPEGGGRNLGEACHIYDLFTAMTDSRVAEVSAQAIRPTTSQYSQTDNFVATMTFGEGSVATLTYTAMGNSSHPKERLDVFVDGAVISLDDYRRLTVVGRKSSGIERRTPAKGQREELVALAGVIREGGSWPIPLWQQVQATDIALTVERHLVDRR